MLSFVCRLPGVECCVSHFLFVRRHVNDMWHFLVVLTNTRIMQMKLETFEIHKHLIFHELSWTFMQLWMWALQKQLPTLLPCCCCSCMCASVQLVLVVCYIGCLSQITCPYMTFEQANTHNVFPLDSLQMNFKAFSMSFMSSQCSNYALFNLMKINAATAKLLFSQLSSLAQLTLKLSSDYPRKGPGRWQANKLAIGPGQTANTQSDTKIQNKTTKSSRVGNASLGDTLPMASIWHHKHY